MLVVDDSAVIRKTLNKRLAAQGYIVTEAASGSDALSLLKSETFDLALLDLIMPDMDGHETLHEIRKLFNPAELPVIMSTAMDQSDDMVASFRLGANDYVTKPINFPVLQARVATHVELKRSNESLEKRVAERTADLQKAKDEMELQAGELARFNSELQDFAYVASHDLQEPLRKILAFGDRLKAKFADDLPEAGRDYIARMQGAANRMSDLVNDLLSFSRVTTRARAFTPVDLSEVLAETLVEFETALKTSGAEIDAGPMPTIDADRSQIRQLFVNLIDNALKFRRPDVPPRIEIRAQASEESCRITVKDNGIGFSPKYTDRIFRVFQRLHSRDEYSGTGIGLAICTKLTERHNGSIEATSEPGAGSTFSVLLPLQQSRNNAETEPDSDREPA